ncbi:MAG: hypothetical protein JNJ56_15570 [Ignavibacteria bacterium]|nr:hypothetical protein [Ignavibacteria bacterium]
MRSLSESGYVSSLFCSVFVVLLSRSSVIVPVPGGFVTVAENNAVSL